MLYEHAIFPNPGCILSSDVERRLAATLAAEVRGHRRFVEIELARAPVRFRIVGSTSFTIAVVCAAIKACAMSIGRRVWSDEHDVD